MNHELQAEVERLGGDSSAPTWQWFLLNGPHGSSFTWGQARREPAGYVGLEHLRSIVAERETADPTFPARAREVVQLSLGSIKRSFLRRAIQVAAVVGGEAELERIAALTGHADEEVASDARACVFVLRRSMHERTAAEQRDEADEAREG